MTFIADGTLRQNLELKAPCPEPASIQAALARLEAVDAGLLVQTDHYFHAPQGRLKLREIAGATAQLIAYDRPEDHAQRHSRYRITAVEDPAGLITVLAAALGLRGVVAKRRQLFLWNQCRIHLDAVEGLGSFLEFEVISAGKARDDRERMDTLMRAFGIRDSDAIRASYSDLLGL